MVVLGDRYELQQVLLNLITNAVQAVSSLPAGRPRKIVVVDRPARSGQAMLRVRDTGPGVPPHHASLSLHAVLHHQGARARAPGSGCRSATAW